MNARSGMLRLFVAAYPPVERAEALARFAAGSGVLGPGDRPVRPEQVHLTLVFLGSVRGRDVRNVGESIARSVSGVEAFMLKPERLVLLPQRGHPRVLAVETDAPAGLLEVQRRLATRLARPKGDRAPERFLPHLTLARFDQQAARPDLRSEALPVLDAATAEAFEVREVRLMSSVLSAVGGGGGGGARHECVMAVPLG
ncbi:MAG: RNA 2',3'-cyclic phosphodiesterase [Phycisphaerae bacterium]|nr:RNA 2',3'-cyclic phosphodiesterase [Phycisphaerae bacterium]